MDVLDRFLRRWGLPAMWADPAFAVTVGTAHDPPVFDDIPFGRECARLLRDACETTGVRLHAYCLMPDHACLVLGLPGRTSLPGIVTGWKSLCAQARRQRGSFAPFWQRGYAERALPSPEAARLAARYVLDKPVRAGLVENCRDYPLCGPFEAVG